MSAVPELKEKIPDAPHPFVISMFFPKGGVGKSSMTMCLATELASLGKKVLLLDLDPQCNLTSTLLNAGEEKDGANGGREGDDCGGDNDDGGDIPSGEPNGSVPRLPLQDAWTSTEQRKYTKQEFLKEIENDAKNDLGIKHEGEKKEEKPNKMQKTEPPLLNKDKPRSQQKNIADYFELFFNGSTHTGKDPLENYDNDVLEKWGCPRPLKPFDQRKYGELSVLDSTKVDYIQDKIFLIPGTPQVR